MSWLLSRWTAWAAIALLAPALMFGAVQLGRTARDLKNEQDRSDQLETSRDAFRDSYAQCSANKGSLTAALEAQNAAVEALRRDAASRVAASARALQAARADGRASALRVAELLNSRPEGADLCAAANSLILETVR